MFKIYDSLYIRDGLLICLLTPTLHGVHLALIHIRSKKKYVPLVIQRSIFPEGSPALPT